MTTLTQPGINNRFVIDREFLIKLLIFFSFFLLSVDIVYKTYYGITYITRSKCILFANLPRWAFLFYEYFIELLLVVIVGIFVASLLEKYFSKFKRIIPKNTILAFMYASVIPACSCSAIPLIRAMKDRIPFRTIITFVVAAPLLNPYIIMLSITVLGVRYAILRIFCSLVLAVSTGYVAEFIYKRMEKQRVGLPLGCMIGGGCPQKANYVYETTFTIFKKILPFMLVAGALSIMIEVFAPGNMLKSYDLSNNFIGTALVILVGVPVYFCNGADVLFLHPLIEYSNLPLGTAMAFSLTSTSVCITSLAMLMKFVGKKLTFVVLSSVVITTFLLSLLIQLIPFV